MIFSVSKKAFLLVCILGIGSLAMAQKITEPSTKTHPDWSRPYPAFQIAGNLYYVGTYDLACYLIVTPQGNILINTGLASSTQSIGKSIESLGFKLADTKILLTTQAHYDHVGAMAAIKKKTGAKLMVDEGDAPCVADGGRSDYSLSGTEAVFAPVKVDRLLHNGDTISLGGMHLVMLHHPGHTKGSCSYLFQVQDTQRQYTVLIANLPTIITDKKFSDITAYPTIAGDYAYTLNAMKNLKFDIWLASHASQFYLHKKHKPGSPYNPSAFMDKQAYYNAIDDLRKEFEEKK